MSALYSWGHNPAHVYFEIILVPYWDYELKKHSVYKSKTFGASEKTVIRNAIDELPESPLKLLLYKILETVGPPPEILTIKSILLKSRSEKVPKSYQLMFDSECFNMITGFSIMGMETYDIKKEFQAMSFKPNYSLEQIERFRSHFWNVKEKEGWDHNCSEALQNIIRSDQVLSASFKHLLEGALSDKNHRDKALHYNLSLSPDDRALEYLRACDNAILVQNQKIQNGDLKGADLAATIVSKTINSAAKLGVTPPISTQKRSSNLLDQ